MLKAHSRLVENLALAGDLFLIAVCWMSAYAIRFHLMHVTDVPPSATTRSSWSRS